MKSAFEKMPNIATISSHVSEAVRWYHRVQLLICPAGSDAGGAVSVAGIGKVPDANAATQ